MAINFNKLFLQNLLPKNQTATHAQASSPEAIFDGTGAQEYPDGEVGEVLACESTEHRDREAQKLSQTLKNLRVLIDKHNKRRTGIKDSPRLQLRAPPYAQSEPHVTEQLKHRKNTLSHQPYQVDAAQVCKDLTHHSTFKTNERMSKKPEKARF